MLTKTQMKNLPTESLVPPDEMSRHHLNPEAMYELESSIREHGIINPITVSPTENNQFKIIAGFRRWLAAKEIGISTIPCSIRYDQTQQEFLTVHENLYRENLNPVEEAEQIHAYIATKNPTLHHLSTAWGKSEAWIQSRIAIGAYPQELREAIEQKKITLGVAQKIMTVSEEWQRKYFIKLAIDTEATIKEIDSWIFTYKGMEDPLPDTVLTREQIEERQKELAQYIDCRICSNRTSVMEVYTLLVCPTCTSSLQKAVEEGRAQQPDKPNEV